MSSIKTIKKILARCEYDEDGVYTLAFCDDQEFLFAWGPEVAVGDLIATNANTSEMGAVAGPRDEVIDYIRKFAQAVAVEDSKLGMQMVAELAPYTDDERREMVAAYADFHGVNESDIDVSPHWYDGRAVGLRLSLDIYGRSRGCDEQYGLR